VASIVQPVSPVSPVAYAAQVPTTGSSKSPFITRFCAAELQTITLIQAAAAKAGTLFANLLMISCSSFV
jgi:hypothetical protein